MDEDIQFVAPSAAELEAFANAMPAFSFSDSADSAPATAATQIAEDVEDNPDEAFEFKLFKSAVPEKVSLQVKAEPSYPAPVRPQSYYFHQPTNHDRSQIQQSAIDGETVMKLSQIPCPWNTRPKRLSRYTKDGLLIKHDADSAAILKQSAETRKTSRWRPSKARRDKFKQLAQAEAERAARLAKLRAGRGGSVRGGRGSARGGINGNRPRDTIAKKDTEKKPPPKGYPRKGGPPI